MHGQLLGVVIFSASNCKISNMLIRNKLQAGEDASHSNKGNWFPWGHHCFGSFGRCCRGMFSWFLADPEASGRLFRGGGWCFHLNLQLQMCEGSPTVQAGCRMSVFWGVGGGFQCSLSPEGDLMVSRNSGLFGSTQHSSSVLLRAGICQFTQGQVP